MLLSVAPRPCAGSKVFQRFRFSNTRKGVSENVLDEVKRPQRNATVRLHPAAQVFSELRVKYRVTTHSKDLSLGAGPLLFVVFQFLRAPD